MKSSLNQNRGHSVTLPDLSTLITLGLISAILGVTFLMYHFFGVTDVGYDIQNTTRSAFRWLYERWKIDLHVTSFAHSHWVPLVSLFLIWRDRAALAKIPCRVFYPGLLVVIIALLFHWAGVKSQQTRLTALSMIMLSWGLPLFVCGWPLAKRLIPPCGMLLFSLPLNFFDAAAYPLRVIAAALTSGLMAGLGLDVNRVGSVIFSNSLDGFGTDLADSRTGIFAITAVVAYSFLAALLANTTWKMRGVLVSLSIPLLIVANVVRGMAVILVAEMLGSQAGTHVYRTFSGPIVCLLSFGGLTILARLFHKRYPAHMPFQQEAAGHVKTTTNQALLISLCVIILATWWIPTNLHITHSDVAGVNLDLPQEIGSWRGGMVLFCHNREHAGDIFAEGQQPGDPCPKCGQPLHEMTSIEQSLLPPDTIIRKNRYENNKDRRVYLSIVLSGQYRSSIHRPEVCLVGPNSQIADSFTHEIHLENGRTLKVKILEMLNYYKGTDGEPRIAASYYAYWFAGMERETHSHLRRMIWMASDRIFRNTSYRWAYISLSGARIPDDTSHHAEIEEFIKVAHPVLIRR